MADEVTTIRKYTEKDIPVIIDMVSRYVPRLPNYQGVVVDPARIKFLLEHNVTNEGQFTVRVLVSGAGQVVGGIGAYCVPLTFSWDMVTCDIFILVDEAWRTLERTQQLYKAYIEWAVARGAKIIQASHAGGHRDEAMARLLDGIGFKQVGSLYQLQRM